MKRPSLLSDFAQMASGAAGLGGVKSEIDMIVQSQLENWLKEGLYHGDFDVRNYESQLLLRESKSSNHNNKPQKSQPRQKQRPKPQNSLILGCFFTSSESAK